MEGNGEGDMKLPNSLAQSNDEAMVKANEKQTDCSGDKRNDAAGHEAVDFLMQMGGEVQKKSWKSKEKKKYKSCYWRKSVTEDDTLEKMKIYLNESSNSSV